ncbi:pyruvate dehydrogenase complex dihydrolipoamide acetyltransferase component (E2) [Serendipita sp. 398]|nr:pyruvate dehydrogenase complex dihydrolipoamide acetyltransferase component (E2) [Serendipita sp. 398]
MPAMSPTMTEGGIAAWKKKEGESYASGDVLLEIETDKATIDVEAQEDGILAKIIAQDGAKGIPVGTAIAITAEEGDDLSGAAEMAKKATSEAPPKADSSQSEKPKQSEEPTKETKPKESSTESKPAPKEGKQDLKKGDRIFATPVAKKIALERGIPLAQVKGTGPEGRILREDVEKWKGSSAAPAGAAAPAPAPASADQYTDIPVSSMRRVIGQRLTQSKQELPHFYVTVDIDMTRVSKLREVFNASLAGKEGGVKISVNDFVMKATSLALTEVPEANSALLGDVIRQYKKADISMAVATPNGLITPIIKDVGSKGLATIAVESKNLAKKARDGKLAPHEYQGGTFTVSNMGMYGISHFTAIINTPQSCILAVSSPVATMVPDASEEKGWTTKQIMKVTLSSDHRTVDGAVAARWLQSFKGYLENPLTFML